MHPCGTVLWRGPPGRLGGRPRPPADAARALLNDGQYDEVPAQIRRFVYAGGVKFKGLVRRREAEATMWMN